MLARALMLLDIGSVLGGIGLAVVAFIVVILVCVVILRLLAVILPSYEEADAVGRRRTQRLGGEPAPVSRGAGAEGDDDRGT